MFKTRHLSLVASVGLTALLCTSSPARAQSLGGAASFAVSGAAAVTAAGAAGTVITGDVGSTNVNPLLAITGFPPAVVTPPFGLHYNDAQAIAAQSGATALFASLNSGACTTLVAELGGTTIPPGNYCFSSTANVAAGTNLVLNGAGTYIFRVGSSLTANVLSTVSLVGVNACNVYWRVASAATLNGINFPGNVVASAGVTLGVGATLTGRALATVGPVTMAGGNSVGGCSGTPSLSLFKQASPTTFQLAGNLISYSYLVTNTGNTSLAGPVTATDDKTTVVCPNVNTVGDFNGSLDPGEVITCTATYTATAADEIAGEIINHATAQAGGTVSSPGMVTVPKIVPVAPAIAIVKLTNGSDHNSSPGLQVTVGSTVTFTYSVVNTGNVTLNPVTLFDNVLGPIAVATDCVPNTTALTPGASMLCTKTVTALVPGTVCNTGTATGTPPTGLPVSASNDECYTANPVQVGTGSLVVTKNTVGGNGSFTFTGTLPTFTITTGLGTGTATLNNLTAGTYSINETPQGGWVQTSSTCSSVVVSAGNQATCTVVNTALPAATGTLVVFKTTVGGNGSFTFNGGSLGIFTLTTLANLGTKTFSGLAPGTYSIIETGLPIGWGQTSSTCGSVTVSAGLVTSCAVVNTGSQPGTGTPGYWKNHPNAWPVSQITVGGVTYTKAKAIAWLVDSVDKDKTKNMFSALVSAMLNVKIGNDDSCVAPTIAAANNWMAIYGPVGKGVRASSYAWKIGEPLQLLLDNYNNGLLCAPHRN